MRRTDCLTTFLSGASLLVLGPVLLILFLQWWVIVLIALGITVIAVWRVIANSTENAMPSVIKVEPQGQLAPEVLSAISETLATPFCSSCGQKFLHTSSAFCPHCGHERSYKPLSALLDIDAD